MVELLCPCGFVQGLSARYSRVERGDRDYHDFKLLCGPYEDPTHDTLPLPLLAATAESRC